jgi:hypothetical protein
MIRIIRRVHRWLRPYRQWMFDRRAGLVAFANREAEERRRHGKVRQVQADRFAALHDRLKREIAQ